MSTQGRVVVSETELFDHLADANVGEAEFGVLVNNNKISMKFHRGTQASLIVAFHGAVDRTKRKLPSFPAFIGQAVVQASQLMIADPSLEQSPTLTASWYLGHSGFELQRLLPPLLGNIIATLGVSRSVFLGTSAGGFAALYYSWHVPGSVAVALNPQTDLARHYRRRLDEYREACWPNLTSAESLLSAVDCNLTTLYSKGFSNTVVYLQNSMDLFHMKVHFAPFLASIGKDFDRLITKVDFWGGFGHSHIPGSEWVRWVAASLAAPTTSTHDILAEYRKDRTTPSTFGEISLQEDLEIAERLNRVP